MRHLAILLAGCIACGSAETSPPAGGGGDAGISTDSGTVPGAYPQGPYGIADGDTLEDMSFDGFFVNGDPSAVAMLTYETEVTLAEARQLGFRFAIVNASTSWCAPCREEAMVFTRDAEKWAAMGGYVFSVLTEDRNFAPATRGTLDEWVREFSPNYTMVHDPRGEIDRIVSPPTYPVNFIVELSTMKIIRARTGLDDELFNIWEQTLTN